ncbi:MAG TPA: glycoside hydrolase family 2 TIM barrel-domain containing protein, partial [Paludibacter sp.]
MRKKYIALLIGILQCLQIFCANREVLLLDKDWYFINKEVINGETEQSDYSAWQKVSVPHDWAIRGNFDMNLDKQYIQMSEDNDKEFKLRTGRTGALPMFGVGWYQKILPVSIEDNGKKIFIEFDGAMSLAKVYINGNFVGEWPYGYSSFSFDITKFIQFDRENLLAVRLENKPESSRWYAGAGIYRNVRLVKTNPVHIAHWGTYITTPLVYKNSAVVNIKTEINCSENLKNEVQLITEIHSKAGSIIGTVKSKLKPTEKLKFNQELKISKPNLWNIENPDLYKAVSKVYVKNQLVDTFITTFGCRSIRFDKDKGFFLNDKPLKIKGVCLHHDLGPLGAAVNKRATERQLLMMKEMGANAIRTSHNPPSPELLELCDSIGLMVQVEAFDEWRIGKNQNGYHNYFDQWAEMDLRNMLQRDRNHPSVIMWSLGNEIRDQRSLQGKETTHFLASICREEDPTRPVTAGFN